MKQSLDILLDSSPTAVICLDTDGFVTMWNPAAQRIFGWSANEALGRRLPTVPPELWDDYWKMYPTILSGEGSMSPEVSCLTRSGDRIPMSIATVPLRNSSGEVEGCLGLLAPVSGGRRSGHALTEASQRLKSFFDLSSDALFVHDGDGEIADCNREAMRSLGLEREEVVGRDIRDFAKFVPDESQTELETIWRAIADGEREEAALITLEFRDGNGTAFLTETHLGPVLYGGRTMVFASARDITERESALRELKKLSERQHLVLDSAGEGIYGLDQEMRITFANPAAAEMTGWSRRELIGRNAHELFHHSRPSGEAYPLEECPIHRTIQSGQRHRITREVLWKKDGTSFPAEYSSTPIREDGGITGAVVVFRDVTDRRRSERLLREREERFRVLFQNSSDVVVISDERMNLGYVTPSVERMMGYRPEELVGRNALDYIHPEDLDRVRVLVSEARGKRGVTPTMELRWRHADGSWRVGEIVGNNLLHEASIRGIVLTIRDVSERKMLEDQLAHQAFHDSLTGLPNRELFMDRLEQALLRSKRRKKAVATLFMDLDNFKLVNDTMGHETGDLLLTEIARRITLCLRESDTASRFGGDEFTVLLEDVASEDDAVKVAERIQQELKAPFILGGREVFVTASLGISLNIYGDENPQDLLRHSDIAVYHAKESGRDRYAVFEPQMNSHMVEQLVLSNDLKRALEREEFVLMYQPKATLATGQLTAVEALLYWEHPERGLLKPGEFISIAEDNGMIVPIGRWVLHEACRQMKVWQSALSDPPACISVNLSIVQLRSGGFADDVSDILKEIGLEPPNLAVEITETLLTQSVERLSGTLDALDSLGVRLSLDDFGSGYSSLATLKGLPLDSLKIDKAFVDDLEDGGQGAEIVRAVIGLAHTLGLKVTAEGVETAGQLELLRRMGCEMAQGYHISRPVPADQATALLNAGLGWPISP